MTRLDQKTITMSGESLQRLKKEYEIQKTKQRGLTFSGFISENAIIELERKKMIRQAYPISVIGFEDNLLYLKDERYDKRFIEVQLVDKKLMCLTDGSDECIHVGFALALPEVRQALNQ